VTAPCTVKLPIFEGPLDLLLHLIKRNEVQVTDIPISAITDQYLALLEELPELNLDGAGEYLVMAATLQYIKSRMLLPAAEDEETEEDPRAELVQQLLEYQRFREVAVGLGERPLLARDVFVHAGEAPEPDLPGEGALVRDASLGDLLDALRVVLARIRLPQAHEVGQEPISLQACVERILGQFVLAARIEFASLFADGTDRPTVIVTFLALLELIRLRVVRARQAERFGPIMLELAVATMAEAAERVQALSDTTIPSLAGWSGGEGQDGQRGVRDS
jgi:segregation and condensation protein A